MPIFKRLQNWRFYPLTLKFDLSLILIERQVGNHLEGIPYYGPRSDISCSEISNRLAGSKRSNSDTAFTGTSRDGIQQMGHDSLESLHLMKACFNNSSCCCLLTLMYAKTPCMDVVIYVYLIPIQI